MRFSEVLAARVAVLALLASGLVQAGAGPASAYTEEPEGYAGYQPENGCRDSPRPGTRELARWIEASFDGGPALASMRPCDRSTSEHQDGRAIDWMMDAAKKSERREVNRFLTRVFAADEAKNEHALARRMGIMYLIWNDRMYSAYRHGDTDHFGGRPYGCGCGSATSRHRDHIHISLSKPGARAATSWYTDAP